MAKDPYQGRQKSRRGRAGRRSLTTAKRNTWAGGYEADRDTHYLVKLLRLGGEKMAENMLLAMFLFFIIAASLLFITRYRQDTPTDDMTAPADQPSAAAPTDGEDIPTDGASTLADQPSAAAPTDGEDTPTPDQSDAVAPAESDAADSITDGPLSAGTWAMYRTNVAGNEGWLFDIRFEGVEMGTLEILNLETEYNTKFDVNDDRVSFKFTELTYLQPPYKTDAIEVVSSFEGTLTDADTIGGTWKVENWHCFPDRDPECTLGNPINENSPDWKKEYLEFESRLVRES